MTNYNERLDKILRSMQVEEYGTVSQADTKQALRTLFQEAMDEVIADVGYSKTVNNYVALQRQRAKALLDEMFKRSPMTIKESEQNLLKALEEV